MAKLETEIKVLTFLQACSKEELQEVDLHLSSYLNKKPDPKYFENNVENFYRSLDGIATGEILEQALKFAKKLEAHNLNAFLSLLEKGFMPQEASAAMEIIDRICTKSALTPVEVTNLMRDFDGLENLRKISLVKKPQLINKPEEDERSM